jgi:hypothetical protein
MKTMSALARVLILGLSLATASAQALVLFDTSGSLSANDPTQLGRLSRNGILQDWAGSEPYPGILNPDTAYHYVTYLINVGITPFVQISMDSNSTNTFVSAYQSSYNPDSTDPINRGLDDNWLGDAGTSGNFFGQPLFFQVTAQVNSWIAVVVNQTGSGASGLSDPFNLLVEGFIDTEYSDPAQVPEPATLLLSLVGLGLVARQRMSKRG